MAKSPVILTGPMAGQEAERKSRYGRKNWVVYKSRDGVLTAEVESADSVKRAMLAKGTGGTFTVIIDGCRMWFSWKLACNLLYQLKYSGDYRRGPAVYKQPDTVSQAIA